MMYYSLVWVQLAKMQAVKMLSGRWIRFFYSRMKGKLDEDVTKLGFPRLLIFKPPSLIRKGSDVSILYRPYFTPSFLSFLRESFQKLRKHSETVWSF